MVVIETSIHSVSIWDTEMNYDSKNFDWKNFGFALVIKYVMAFVFFLIPRHWKAHWLQIFFWDALNKKVLKHNVFARIQFFRKDMLDLINWKLNYWYLCYSIQVLWPEPLRNRESIKCQRETYMAVSVVILNNFLCSYIVKLFQISYFKSLPLKAVF